MAGPTRISQLTDGAPVQETDQIPVARGSGASGYTYKVDAGRLVSDLLNVTNSPSVNLSFDTSTRTLSADVSTAVKEASAFNVVDSSTIDLDWNAFTRTLSSSVIDNSIINAKLAFDGGSFGFRNKLINAQGLINQRVYVSGTATTTANQYTVDRWKVVTSGQNLTFSTTANVVTFTAPAGGVEQVVEGLNVESGTYVLSWTGTATATVNGTARAKGESFSLTGGSNITVRFSSGTFSLPQLEKGTSGTPFEYKPFGTELALCQRYFLKVNGVSLLGRSIPTRNFTVAPTSWTNYFHTIVYYTPVPMRGAASVSVKVYKGDTLTQGTPTTLGMDADFRTISIGITDVNTGFYDLREVVASAEL